MIDPQKDIFSHLVISADRFRDMKTRISRSKENIRPILPSVLMPEKRNAVELQTRPEISEKLAIDSEQTIESKIVEELPRLPKTPPANKFKKVIIKRPRIEEQVVQLVENPEVKALKQELEELEKFFIELKKKETNRELVWKLENKIVELKKFIEEKSYI